MELLKFTSLIVFCLLLPVALAAEAVDVEHIGYGDSTLEVNILIKNTGDTALSDIGIFDNGVEYKTVQLVIGPGMNFEETLYLDEGSHKIEVWSGDAYDFLEVNAIDIPPQPTETTIPIPPGQTEQDNTWVTILVIVIVVCIVFFVAFRRPELKLSSGKK